MGSIYNMTLTLYKEPEFKMEFNEKLNALCFTAQDLTIDLDMPYFRLNVETQKQQFLDLNFDLDYYVNRRSRRLHLPSVRYHQEQRLGLARRELHTHQGENQNSTS